MPASRDRQPGCTANQAFTGKGLEICTGDGPASHTAPPAVFPARAGGRKRTALVVSTLGFLLVAAAIDRQASLARLGSMPDSWREELFDKLRRFDLVLTPEQRASVLQIDSYIQSLEPERRLEALAAARRFHAWLGTLPENVRDDILARPPGERMSEIRKLLAKHPIPHTETPRLLQLIEIGEYSPFELASIYRIWQALTDAERKQIERLPPGPRRAEELFHRGQKKGIERETIPADFDERHWVAYVEAALKKRPIFLLEELKKKGETARREQILRRQAVNAYLIAHPTPQVTPERLEQFAASFPEWIQASFDPFPPDEARRWLSVAYRLVFPPGSEIKRAVAGSPGTGVPRTANPPTHAKPAPNQTPLKTEPSPF